MISAVHSTKSVISNSYSTNKNSNANAPACKAKNNVSFGAVDPSILGLGAIVLGGVIGILTIINSNGEERAFHDYFDKKSERELSHITDNPRAHGLFRRLKK